MISLKASFTPTKHPLFHNRGLTKRKKNSILFLCKSNPEAPPPEGDTSKQELLARIAMLQTQKVRLTDYLDERSAYLTQFAEEANAEFDQVGQDALKELDEASARIMGNIESRMQAFEESAEMNKLEIEKSKDKITEFEGQIQRERNEGMFFKSLGEKTKTPPGQKVKAEAKVESDKIKEVTKESVGSKTRMNIYLALIGVLIIGIVDSFVSSSSSWAKVAVLGMILVGLVSQFMYEQKMLSETETKLREKTKEEKQ